MYIQQHLAASALLVFFCFFLCLSGQRIDGETVIEFTVGGVVSTTVTLNEPWPVLPCESVELHETTCVPSEKTEPDGGVQVTEVLRSTRSVAVTVKLTVAPAGLVASAVMSAGTLTVGGVVSTTVTLNEPVP